MVSIVALWLPVLLAAVVVFFASSVVHMVLGYHRTDYRPLPDEDRVLAMLAKEEIPPGDYAFPHAASPKEMGSPEMIAKFDRGPVGLVTVLPSRPPAMGKYLVQWFGYCLGVGVFAAYLSGRTLAPGADYLAVFRVVGAAAFLGYGAGHTVESIWKGQAWSTTVKHTADGLVYALLTAGVFGWLWP